MKRLAVIGVAIVGVGVAVAWGRSPARAETPMEHVDTRASATGRVEGRHEPIELRAATEGIVASIGVEEGSTVTRDQVIATLDCRDFEAEAAAAASRVRRAVAERTRLLRGGREAARREAAAGIDAAEARLAEAQLALRRATELWDSDRMIPRAQVDAAARDERVAAADLRAARERAGLADAEALPEEIAAADEAIAAARFSEDAARARAAKCIVRSPIDGVVLRVPVHVGERAATGAAPIAIVADMTALRVRAEIDERDVGRVHPGQRVILEAGALGNQQRTGTVRTVAPIMGRRTMQSGDPSEKADRDVREILIDVDGRDPHLITGLRVVVLFAAGESWR